MILKKEHELPVSNPHRPIRDRSKTFSISSRQNTLEKGPILLKTYKVNYKTTHIIPKYMYIFFFKEKADKVSLKCVKIVEQTVPVIHITKPQVLFETLGLINLRLLISETDEP